MGRLSWPDVVRNDWLGIVPVPLAPTRERERGYNQSRLLADALAQQWRLPAFHELLFRTAQTRAQAQLTAEERLHNVAGAFRVAVMPPKLEGSHLVLVDDVITTGATVKAVTKALKSGGAERVDVVSFARVVTGSDA